VTALPAFDPPVIIFASGCFEQRVALHLGITEAELRGVLGFPD
jgi:hypothetical protein